MYCMNILLSILMQTSLSHGTCMYIFSVWIIFYWLTNDVLSPGENSFPCSRCSLITCNSLSMVDAQSALLCLLMLLFFCLCLHGHAHETLLE